MYLIDSLLYPFMVKGKFKVILIGIILNLIPIFGNLVWYGYSIKVMREVMQGRSAKLPGIDIVDDFITALAFVLSLLVHILVIGVLIIVFDFVWGFIGGLLGFSPGFIVGVINLVSFIGVLILTFIFNIGIIRYAGRNGDHPLFEIRKNWQYLTGDFFPIFIASVYTIVMAVIFIVLFMTVQYGIVQLELLPFNLPSWYIWGIVGLISLSAISIYTVYSISSSYIYAQAGIAMGVVSTPPSKLKNWKDA